jgi:DNA polymerase V
MQHRRTEAVRQGYLFEEGDTPESRTLMKTLNAINWRMGRGTVFYGGSGIRREWAPIASRKSPAYTTYWEQIMTVRV